MMDQAEKMVKKKPREFLLGFMVILLLFFGATFLAGYFYYQNPPKGMIKTKEKKPVVVVKKKEYYILKQGESLSDVATTKYGNSLLYPTIIKLNQIKYPDFVEPGTRLRIR